MGHSVVKRKRNHLCPGDLDFLFQNLFWVQNLVIAICVVGIFNFSEYRNP